MLFCVCTRVFTPRILLRNGNFPKRTFHAINTNMKTTNVAPILKNVNKTLTHTRSFSISKFFKWFRKPTKKDLYKIDEMPEHYELIYRSTMERYLLAAHVVTIVTVAVTLVSLVFVTEIRKDLPFRSHLYDYSPRLSQNEVILYGTVFMGLAVLMNVLLARMPLRIYSNASKNKEYVMIFYGSIPYTTKKLTCKVGQIAAVPTTEYSLIPWKGATYVFESKMDKRTLIMMDECFRTPADLYIMIGMQSDPDNVDSDGEKSK